MSGLLVNRKGELLLFDCGEGTQRQMMRYGTGFGVGDIFFTHMHADHFIGVIGLLRTMGLQGRTDPIRLWGPAGSRAILRDAVNLGVERVPFEIEIAELKTGAEVRREEYRVIGYAVRHGARALGYALVEDDRLGRFDPERARASGVPEGPLFGRLHRGEAVEVDGRVIDPASLVGPPRPGRKLVYTGDTRPCRGTHEAARGADLLIHDATFAHDEAERARATGHSTAQEAAELARKAGVHRLVLTHLSSRYAEDPRRLEQEARKRFAGAIVAYDGLEIELPYRDTE